MASDFSQEKLPCSDDKALVHIKKNNSIVTGTKTKICSYSQKSWRQWKNSILNSQINIAKKTPQKHSAFKKAVEL